MVTRDGEHRSRVFTTNDHRDTAYQNPLSHTHTHNRLTDNTYQTPETGSLITHTSASGTGLPYILPLNVFLNRQFIFIYRDTGVT